jgi:ABC-2 type transport system permease protein
MKKLANIYRLGVKELWSLWRDPVMLLLIVYSFTLMIYNAASAVPETLHKATIAIVDEDGSPLATRIATAFYPPYFLKPEMISFDDVDPGMDAGRFTFAIDIPPNFQRDVLANRSPALQLNVDATRISQAFTGYVDIQQILQSEVNEFVQRYRANLIPPVDLAMRVRFNPNLERPWFGAVVQLIDAVTILSIILAGVALIREREHGTVEHLLVMPVTPAEIMLAKVWSAALVVLIATAFSLGVVVQWILEIPVEGPAWLFLACAALHLFATTSMGIFLATIARSMPQFGLLFVLVLVPMSLLSGGVTPRESMPEFVQKVMLGAPTTHFVAASQGILFRGGGIDVVWPQMLALSVIASVFFTVALLRFRKTITLMA